MKLAYTGELAGSGYINYHDQVKNDDHPLVSRLDIDPDHQGINYTYKHIVLMADLALRDTRVLVAKDLWRPPSDPNAFFVGFENLSTGEAKEMSVLRSSVDRARTLRIQIADQDDINNWAEGMHPAYSQPPRERRQLEISLDPEYRARQAIYRLGTGVHLGFEEGVGIEAASRLVESIKNSKKQLDIVDGQVQDFRQAA